MRKADSFLSGTVRRRDLQARLEDALERGHVWPAFQPIVDLHCGSLAGFEILARWSDPELGDISPAQFIPVLDEHHLVDTLLEGLMRSACPAAVPWRGRFFLAFNVAPSQILGDDLPERISAVASQTGFPLERIQLEIVESSLISDGNAAFRTLSRLSEIGVAISLDDFGTGYSSLARLEAFPFRKLKIDAQFVRRLQHDNRKRRIVSAVVGLGQSLGITVVGEGVETEAEAAILRALGCPLGQGWLYGGGMPATEAKDVCDRLAVRVTPTSHLDTSPFQQLHQLETLYDQAPVGLCFLDLEYRHVRANDIFAAMHGLTGRELEGKTIYDVMEGETLQRVKEVLAGAVGSHPLPPQDYLMGDREYRVFAQRVIEVGGENIGFSVVAIDVTEPNRVLRTLEQSEAHFRHAVELNPDIAWATNAQGDLDYISPTFEDPPNDTMQDRIDRWLGKMHPDDRAGVHSAWLEWLPSGKPWEVKFRIARPDGTYRPVLSRARAYIDSEGKVVRWYGVISDYERLGLRPIDEKAAV